MRRRARRLRAQLREVVYLARDVREAFQLPPLPSPSRQARGPGLRRRPLRRTRAVSRLSWREDLEMRWLAYAHLGAEIGALRRTQPPGSNPT